MPLLFPLHRYDASGLIIPPKLYWFSLLVLARSYLVLVGALSFRQDSSGMLTLFYPRQWDLAMGLMVGAPAILLFLLTGFRQRLRDAGHYWPFSLARPLLVVFLGVDLVLQLTAIYLQHGRFAWLPALSLVLTFAVLMYIWRSKLVRAMFADWRRPTRVD